MLMMVTPKLTIAFSAACLGLVSASATAGTIAFAGNTSLTTSESDVDAVEVAVGGLQSFAFYNDAGNAGDDTGGVVTPFSEGGGLIGDITIGANDANGGRNEVFPSSTGILSDTAVEPVSATGSIDVSGLLSGTITFYHGSFRQTNTVTVASSLDGSVNAGTTFGPPDNFEAVSSSFDFTDGASLGSINFDFTNDDNDSSPGSRARFFGVTVQGIVPEPSSFALLCLIGIAGLAHRR